MNPPRRGAEILVYPGLAWRVGDLGREVIALEILDDGQISFPGGIYNLQQLLVVIQAAIDAALEAAANVDEAISPDPQIKKVMQIGWRDHAVSLFDENNQLIYHAPIDGPLVIDAANSSPENRLAINQGLKLLNVDHIDIFEFGDFAHASFSADGRTMLSGTSKTGTPMARGASGGFGPYQVAQYRQPTRQFRTPNPVTSSTYDSDPGAHNWDPHVVKVIASFAYSIGFGAANSDDSTPPFYPTALYPTRGLMPSNTGFGVQVTGGSRFSGIGPCYTPEIRDDADLRLIGEHPFAGMMDQFFTRRDADFPTLTTETVEGGSPTHTLYAVQAGRGGTSLITNFNSVRLQEYEYAVWQAVQDLRDSGRECEIAYIPILFNSVEWGTANVEILTLGYGNLAEHLTQYCMSLTGQSRRPVKLYQSGMRGPSYAATNRWLGAGVRAQMNLARMNPLEHVFTHPIYGLPAGSDQHPNILGFHQQSILMGDAMYEIECNFGYRHTDFVEVYQSGTSEFTALLYVPGGGEAEVDLSGDLVGVGTDQSDPNWLGEWVGANDPQAGFAGIRLTDDSGNFGCASGDFVVGRTDGYRKFVGTTSRAIGTNPIFTYAACCSPLAASGATGTGDNTNGPRGLIRSSTPIYSPRDGGIPIYKWALPTQLKFSRSG